MRKSIFVMKMTCTDLELFELETQTNEQGKQLDFLLLKTGEYCHEIVIR